MSILTPKRLNHINKNNPYRKKFLDIRNEFRRKKNKNKKKFNKTVNYFKEAKKILLASFQNHKLFYGGGQGQSGDKKQQDALTKVMASASLNPESQIKLFEKTGQVDIEKLLNEKVPLRRLGNTIDIAGFAVFLSSSKFASFFNGSCVIIDGGQKPCI